MFRNGAAVMLSKSERSGVMRPNSVADPDRGARAAYEDRAAKSDPRHDAATAAEAGEETSAEKITAKE